MGFRFTVRCNVLVAILVCFSGLGFSVLAGAAQAATLTAGAGRADIEIAPSLFPVEEFSIQHDPLAVRAVLLDDGKTRVGLLVVDQTSISESMITQLKSILQEVAGVLPQNALICASHTFSAPHAFLRADMSAAQRAEAEAYVKAIDTAAWQAVTSARKSLSPARIGVGQGSSRIGVNREVPTPGGWWLGANEAGFADPAFGVIRIDGADGLPKAVLMNAAVQPALLDASTLAAGGRAISADLAGAASRHVETHYGKGVVAAYLVGAAGDQVPYFQARRFVTRADGNMETVDLHEAAFPLLDLFGDRLGSAVERVTDSIQSSPAADLAVLRQTIEVPAQGGARGLPTGPVKTYTYTPAGTAQVPVVVVRIGDTVLVGLQAELSATLGAQIRAASPFSHTLVMTLVDGAAKYMPDATAYPRFTYTARNSRYAQGAGEITVRAIGGMLQSLHGSH